MPMPKLSSDARAARRGNLLDAARRCFATHGINVSVEEICVEAKVSKGAFYGYFKSKDAIVEALASAHTDAIDTLTNVRSIDELADRLFTYVHEGNSASSRLELEAWTHSIKQPALRAILQDNAGHLRDALAGTLSKHTRGIDANLKAGMLQIFAAGLVSTAALNDGDFKDARQMLNQFINLIVRDAD